MRDALIALSIVVAVILFTVSGYAEQVDNFLLEKRFELLMSPIDANSVVVEIDTKSLQAMPKWPWSRSVYADLIETINKAEANSISFDIDFSAPSDERGDRAFADAIESSNSEVFLAAHRQQLSSDLPDVIAEILPHPILRENAQLAAVIYPIDDDGVIRSANGSVEFSFATMPTIGAALAKRGLDKNSYFVDYSIDINSIDRISVIDVLEGNFPSEFFLGKVVFVGATAIELGDEYVMPSYGLRSGVFLNALSYETLIGKLELARIDYWPIFLITLSLCAVLCARPLRTNPTHFALYNIALASFLIATPIVAQAYLNTIVPSAGLHMAQILCFLYVTALELEKRALQAFKSHAAEKDTHALLQTLVLDTYEGFITVNHNGEIGICNSRALQLLGAEDKSLVGEKIENAFPKIASHFDRDDLRVGMLKNFVIEEKLEDQDHIRAIEVTVTRSVVELAKSRFEKRTTERGFVVFAIHDITAQKRTELVERAAKESYAAMSAAKSQLISSMSHELRTPLNSIIGFSDILRSDNNETSTASEHREYANMINQSGRNLLSVLNDILFAANLQSGEVALEFTDEPFGEIIEDAFEAVKNDPAWGDRHFVVDDTIRDSAIECDPKTITYALRHLIGNAIKFSGCAGKIELWTENVDNMVELHIKDDGVGCPAELILKLKDMFFQGDGARDRSHEGTGLGLYVCDAIVRLHGGNLALQSSEGQGFEAIISLRTAKRNLRSQNAA